MDVFLELLTPKAAPQPMASPPAPIYVDATVSHRLEAKDASAMLESALELVRAAGYRVTKARPKAVQERPTLNALGKPISPLFDPAYRMKYRTPHAPYGASTAAGNGALYQYKASMEVKHKANPAALQEVFARQGIN